MDPRTSAFETQCTPRMHEKCPQSSRPTLLPQPQEVIRSHELLLLARGSKLALNVLHKHLLVLLLEHFS